MLWKEIKKRRISLLCQKYTKKGILADALVLPQQHGGGLHFHVMLCERGLGTTHIHRPLTTYVLGAKIRTIIETCKHFGLFLIYAVIWRARSRASLMWEQMFSSPSIVSKPAL